MNPPDKSQDQDVTPDPLAGDARVQRFIEKRMGRAEREAYLAEIVAEPEKARELQDLERIVEVLHAAPVLEAPPHFLRDVQGRIRRRTRGRYFGVTVSHRLPWEAIINGVLLFVLFVVYFFGMPIADKRVLVPIPKATFEARTDNHGTAAAVLYGLGKVDQVVTNGHTYYRLVVAPDRVELAEREIALYPFLSIEGRAEVDTGMLLNIRYVAR